MRVVFLKCNNSCRLSKTLNKLHYLVVGYYPQFIHCGIEWNGEYIHATLDGLALERWTPAHERLCTWSYEIEFDSPEYHRTTNGIRLLGFEFPYRIRYRDWWAMLGKRKARNCADFVAQAMGLYELTSKFIMPDDLYEYFMNTTPVGLDNSS